MEQREKKMKTTMERINILEEKHAKSYDERTQVWTQLTKYAEMQEIG
jgi:hypothetical protein